jgi:glycosyltransferase involved in cell wall biosynthesis
MEHSIRRPVRVVYCFSHPCPPRINPRSPSSLAFGFIGRLIPEKGIDIILRLSQEPSLANIRWHLWGSLDAYPPDFVNGFPNVLYHGLLSASEELSEAMQSIDVFALFSSHREGLPLSLLEAMSSGLPWIASDRGGISDLFIDRCNTILLPQDFSYLDALNATRKMAENVSGGLTSPAALIRAYQTQFSPYVLTNEWSDLLS